MTEQELVEALAAQLYEAHWVPSKVLVGREIFPYAEHQEAEKRAWRSVAALTLRQMKWAVSSCRLQVDLTTTGRKATAIFVPSLAPEDFGIEGEAEKA